MTLRNAIIAMTTLAVISDSILIPFYPQLFAARFGVIDAFQAGAFVAAISLVVMLSLPGWARVARRIDTTHLLIWTQCAAGMLALLSSVVTSVVAFWAVSLTMFAFKSSYLLMYPYLMRHEPAAARSQLIGLLCVVVHFGAIFGALIGGAGMQWLGPTPTLIAMAAGDFAQMVICAALIRRHAIPRYPSGDGGETHAALPLGQRWVALKPVLRLAAVMFAFDFNAYLVRPFFSSYWEAAVFGTAHTLPGDVARLAIEAPVHQRLLALFIDVFDGFFRHLNAILVTYVGCDESVFWSAVASCIERYQREHPEFADKFAQFDLFAPEFEHACLNRLQLANNRSMVNLADPFSSARLANPLVNPIARFAPNSF